MYKPSLCTILCVYTLLFSAFPCPLSSLGNIFFVTTHSPLHPPPPPYWDVGVSNSSPKIWDLWSGCGLYKEPCRKKYCYVGILVAFIFRFSELDVQIRTPSKFWSLFENDFKFCPKLFRYLSLDIQHISEFPWLHAETIFPIEMEHCAVEYRIASCSSNITLV